LRVNDINSANVIQACEKAVTNCIDSFQKTFTSEEAYPGWVEKAKNDSDAVLLINKIKNLAEFSEKFTMQISIDHNDFSLIGEYLTLPSQPVKEFLHKIKAVSFDEWYAKADPDEGRSCKSIARESWNSALENNGIIKS